MRQLPPSPHAAMPLHRGKIGLYLVRDTGSDARSMPFVEPLQGSRVVADRYPGVALCLPLARIVRHLWRRSHQREVIRSTRFINDAGAFEMWRQDVTMTAGKMPALQFGMRTLSGCNNSSPGSASEASATLGIKAENHHNSEGVAQISRRHNRLRRIEYHRSHCIPLGFGEFLQRACAAVV